MESFLTHAVRDRDHTAFVFEQQKKHVKPNEESCDVKSCWYCSRPISNRRTYCSTVCREAMYEDNEYAKSRRMILGCQC